MSDAVLELNEKLKSLEWSEQTCFFFFFILSDTLVMILEDPDFLLVFLFNQVYSGLTQPVHFQWNVLVSVPGKVTKTTVVDYWRTEVRTVAMTLTMTMNREHNWSYLES